MLRRLRARITLLAVLLTGAVLTAERLSVCGVTRSQYAESRRAACEPAVGQRQ